MSEQPASNPKNTPPPSVEGDAAVTLTPQEEALPYHNLDADRILATIQLLGHRIDERFPDAGLYGVNLRLEEVAGETKEQIATIKEPIVALRLAALFFAAVIIVSIIATFFALRMPGVEFSFIEFVQVLEAGINDLVLIAAALIFLISYETRIKRKRTLRALHELRSIAHIIDMHQLTKAPERVLGHGGDTASSPRRVMSKFELSRYLDYCSEMLALTGKIAALYAEQFDEPAILTTVNDIETLTTSLSRKIWQKLMILHSHEHEDGTSAGDSGSRQLRPG